MTKYFIGVDVGTGSVRAGIFDRDGRMVATAKRDIALYQDAAGHRRAVEREHLAGGLRQRSRGAWPRRVSLRADVKPASVSTRPARSSCWGQSGRALAVGAHGDSGPQHHRLDGPSCDRSGAIGSTHGTIRSSTYVGGAISPEMETPKLLWLKENLPATYSCRLAVLRSCRLPDLARNRLARAFNLHRHLQMDLLGS